MSIKSFGNMVGDHHLRGTIENLEDLEDLIENLNDFKSIAKERHINYRGHTIYGSYEVYSPNEEIRISLHFNPDDEEIFSKI